MQIAPGHGLALAFLAGLLVLWLGVFGWVLRDAALPDTATGTVLAVFPPDQPAHAIYTAILAAGGGVAQNTWFGNIWLVQSDEPGFVGRLQAAGAWAAFAPQSVQPVALGGCF